MSIEVTVEEATAWAATTPFSSSGGGNGHGSSSVKKKLTKLIKPLGRNLQLRSPKLNRSPSNPEFSSRAEIDGNSYNGESIAPTLASLDTVKMSNRQAQSLLQTGDPPEGKKAPWKKLFQFMGLPPVNSTTKTGCQASSVVAETLPMLRAHSKSLDFVGSLMSNTDTAQTNNKKQTQMMGKEKRQSMFDDVVRGRLDGMDLLYLGPAYRISVQPQNKAKTLESGTPWEPAPSYSFAGRSTLYTAGQIVADMMRTSLPGQSPEIILDGFFRDHRWIVHLDVPKEKKRGCSPRSDAGELSRLGVPTVELTDHSQTSAPDEIPRHKLWSSMWGSDAKPPPKPFHMTSVEDVDPDVHSILEMAAFHSVPIDVDEDTFMISNAYHLKVVHDLASMQLQHGRFNEAMEIFKIILRGLKIQDNEALRHVEGVTLHNMSVIAMWQENFEQALALAGKAVKVRIQYLPEGHPDIAVSLVRQGYAYFALERFDLAEASFHTAVEKLNENNVVKAKVLLNLGVAQYQRGDDAGALKNFTDALEIQRLWLQGPVRREATIIGAAVMLGNLGKIHIKRGDFDLAVSAYEEALLLQLSVYRADHDLVLGNLVSLSLVWSFNSQRRKAGQILNGVLRSQLSSLGPATAPVVETTGAIGNLHFGIGNYEDALKCFTPVLKWQKMNLHSDHPALRKTEDIINRSKKLIQAVWV